MQLNQYVRSQGTMGIFRQGEPRSSLCRIVATSSSAPCHSGCACDGEMGIAQQKEIQLCRGDLSLSDYDNGLEIPRSIHLKCTFIPQRYKSQWSHVIGLFQGLVKPYFLFLHIICI